MVLDNMSIIMLGVDITVSTRCNLYKANLLCEDLLLVRMFKPGSLKDVHGQHQTQQFCHIPHLSSDISILALSGSP